MAKRDFAQVQAQVKKKPVTGRLPAVMTAVSLLFTAILAFSGGYMAGNTQNSTHALQAEKVQLQTRIEGLEKHISGLEQQLAASLEREKPAAKKAAAERIGDLTFYSELPKQKVMPQPLGDTGPAAVQSGGEESHEGHAAISKLTSQASDGHTDNNPVADMATYRLQVGSFVRRSDAEVLLNRMALAGIKATVSEAQVSSMGTRYRVFTAAYTGMAEAEGAKSQLKEKLGINGLLMRE